MGSTDFMPASQETYAEAYAGGFTNYTVMADVENDGSSGAVLGGFTVTLSLGGTTVTTFSLGQTTFPRTLPLFMTPGESENFYDDMAGDSGPDVIHINGVQFAEQACSAVAWKN